MDLKRKYRPVDLHEIFGNDDQVQKLDLLLNRESGIPQAFALVGPRGCGKTTIARIIAKRLGCSDYDFKEMNSSDDRSINTIRKIREDSKHAPMTGGVRVYFFDEAHKLLDDAQNALLKLLEEPPSHVYFIIATTRASRLLDTIHSRCINVTVMPLSKPEMMALLNWVLESEGVTHVAQSVLDRIYELSEGSPRDGLGLLDSIINITDEGQALRSLTTGIVEDHESIELCRLLFERGQHKWEKFAQILKGLQADPEEVRQAVLGYARSVALNQTGDKAGRAIAIIELFQFDYDRIGKSGLLRDCYRAWELLNPKA